MILIRITWIVAIITLIYQDNPNFPLEIVFISTFLSYIIPVILYKLQKLYVVTEIILVGGLSLYFAYTYHLAQFLSPAILTLAFFCRGKVNFYALPAMIIISVLGVFFNFGLDRNKLLLSIFDVLFIYGVGHLLQRVVYSMDAIKQKRYKFFYNIIKTM